MDTLSIERIWEDVDFFQIEVNAESGLARASVKSYTTASSINELASHLATFPQKFNDRFLWENGTKGDISTPFVSFEVWNKDNLGHVVVEVYMEIDDGASYNKHNCCFFVTTEVGQLNSFGKSLVLLNNQGVGKKIILSGVNTRGG